MPGSGEQDSGTLEGTGSEEERFRRLFDRYSRPVAFFFARRGFSAEESRDLTQETFLGAYRGMSRFRHEASSKTWLFTIASNIWRNEARRRSAAKREAEETSLQEVHQTEETATRLGTEGGLEKEDRGEGLALASKSRGPLDDLLIEERAKRLRRALDELPPQMRRCMLLRLSHDLKYHEIAAVMQLSINTVKSQLFQARERLKKTLADETGGDLKTGT